VRAFREGVRVALGLALLLVTHDHDVIDEVATRIWSFNHGRIEDFKGTYEQSLAQSEQLASPVTR
jgi:ATPase subunit of ABC transporter with duplicated ATPase domains